ncbi:hypothetical protein DERF_004746 [Dermatophagoides farinae]|uniref:Uncharacterized protein n=1 Tax=Dermatophagoides farinae TaxID=6954 RepID=A0A922L809_DERFA|nr:hypothetical protein DERF_004746 [Dermatophagoides farinae]
MSIQSTEISTSGLAYFPKQKSGQFIDQYFSTIGSPSLLLTSRYRNKICHFRMNYTITLSNAVQL